MRRVLIVLCLCAAVCGCYGVAQSGPQPRTKPEPELRHPDQVRLDSLVAHYQDAKEAAKNELVEDEVFRNMRSALDSFFNVVQVRDWNCLLTDIEMSDFPPLEKDLREVTFSLSCMDGTPHRLSFDAKYTFRLSSADTDEGYNLLKGIDSNEGCRVTFSGKVEPAFGSSTVFGEDYLDFSKHMRGRLVDDPVINLKVTKISLFEEPEASNATDDTTEDAMQDGTYEAEGTTEEVGVRGFLERVRKHVEGQHVD